MAAESAGRKSIEYVMTTAGPEPLDNIQHPLDREHYVTKQVRPVAEPVLADTRAEFRCRNRRWPAGGNAVLIVAQQHVSGAQRETCDTRVRIPASRSAAVRRLHNMDSVPTVLTGTYDRDSSSSP